MGCLKLQVIFRKRATNYEALLQKMTYKRKAYLCTSNVCMTVVDSYTCMKECVYGVCVCVVCVCMSVCVCSVCVCSVCV